MKIGTISSKHLVERTNKKIRKMITIMIKRMEEINKIDLKVKKC
jgi:hypothetical protein